MRLTGEFTLACAQEQSRKQAGAGCNVVCRPQMKKTGSNLPLQVPQLCPLRSLPLRPAGCGHLPAWAPESLFSFPMVTLHITRVQYQTQETDIGTMCVHSFMSLYEM